MVVLSRFSFVSLMKIMLIWGQGDLMGKINERRNGLFFQCSRRVSWSVFAWMEIEGELSSRGMRYKLTSNVKRHFYCYQHRIHTEFRVCENILQVRYFHLKSLRFALVIWWSSTTVLSFGLFDIFIMILYLLYYNYAMRAHSPLIYMNLYSTRFFLFFFFAASSLSGVLASLSLWVCDSDCTTIKAHKVSEPASLLNFSLDVILNSQARLNFHHVQGPWPCFGSLCSAAGGSAKLDPNWHSTNARKLIIFWPFNFTLCAEHHPFF